MGSAAHFQGGNVGLNWERDLCPGSGGITAEEISLRLPQAAQHNSACRTRQLAPEAGATPAANSAWQHVRLHVPCGDILTIGQCQTHSALSRFPFLLNDDVGKSLPLVQYQAEDIEQKAPLRLPQAAQHNSACRTRQLAPEAGATPAANSAWQHVRLHVPCGDILTINQCQTHSALSRFPFLLDDDVGKSLPLVQYPAEDIEQKARELREALLAGGQ
ncbi:hypothetical protein GPALN_006077 [Globodera pallida]|nr:hypothetical protein GPALN_006077 [Globodera pallida]